MNESQTILISILCGVLASLPVSYFLLLPLLLRVRTALIYGDHPRWASRNTKIVNRACEYFQMDPRDAHSVRITRDHWFISLTNGETIQMPNPDRMRERRRQLTR